MDSLNASFRQFNDGRFEERWQKLREETLNDPRVQSFLNAHPELKGKPAENRLNELYQYKNQWQNCDQCPGLDACPNLIQGYQPELKIYRGDIQLQYHPCPLKRKDDERKRQASFIQSLYLPKEMTEVSFDDFHEDNASRTDAFTKAMQFCSEIAPGEKGGDYIFTGRSVSERRFSSAR